MLDPRFSKMQWALTQWFSWPLVKYLLRYVKLSQAYVIGGLLSVTNDIYSTILIAKSYYNKIIKCYGIGGARRMQS